MAKTSSKKEAHSALRMQASRPRDTKTASQRQQETSAKPGATPNRPAGMPTSKEQHAHGKDARLVQSIRSLPESTTDGKGEGSSFDPKTIGKKSVFRPILMSPYKADWPQVKTSVANALLYSLVELASLEGVKGQLTRSRAGRSLSKKMAAQPITSQGVDMEPRFDSSSISDHAENKRDDTILCGLNSITRVLESAVDRAFANDATSSTRPELEPHFPDLILVCQDDVDPAALTAHMPMLVATLNAILLAGAKKDARLVHLVRLPAGSEVVLADALGLRRCAAVSLDMKRLADFPTSEVQSKVRHFVEGLREKLRQGNVEPLRLAWLESAVATASTKVARSEAQARAAYLEPRVKHVHTSAPADMNAIKQERRSKRQARKQFKKAMATQKKRQASKKGRVTFRSRTTTKLPVA